MEVSCKELIAIFETVGGKFECNYNNKKCTFYPQNIECKIKSTDGGAIDMMLWRYHVGVTYSKIHRYQDLSTSGFIVEFYKNKDGDIYPTPEINK